MASGRRHCCPAITCVKRRRNGCGCRGKFAGQGLNAWIWLQLELLAHQLAIYTSVLYRGWRISSQSPRAHQAECGRGIKRIERRATSQNGDGRGVLSLGLQRTRTCIEKRGQPLRTLRSLFVDPAFELGRSVDRKPVQQRAAVARDRPRGVVRGNGLFQLGDVCMHALGIEGELGRTNNRVVSAEQPFDGVERLRQRMPRTLGLGIGPQQVQQSFTRNAALAVPGQYAENSGETSRDCGAAADAVNGGAKAAKHSHSDHLAHLMFA